VSSDLRAALNFLLWLRTHAAAYFHADDFYDPTKWLSDYSVVRPYDNSHFAALLVEYVSNFGVVLPSIWLEGASLSSKSFVGHASGFLSSERAYLIWKLNGFLDGARARRTMDSLRNPAQKCSIFSQHVECHCLRHRSNGPSISRASKSALAQ
jgi:hypothetical protein